MSGNNRIRIYKGLYPISWLYGIGVWLRNRLFDKGFLPEHGFAVPVISVGNITVGGTGKTPHTEYLIRLLQSRYRVAVLSRGYKRRSEGFVRAGADTPMSDIGDEPFQMKQKFPGIQVAVDKDRCHGIGQLIDSPADSVPDVILLDDAFQHRYVKPGLNILLIDYHRPIDEDALLPAGRMREPASGKERADIVVLTKCPPRLTPTDMESWKARMRLNDGQQLYFTTLVYGDLYALSGTDRRPLSSIAADCHILLLTGIASPDRLVQHLSAYTPHVHPLTFSDHHDFTLRDRERIGRQYHALPAGKRIIITTEKDAVRLKAHPLEDAEAHAALYVLPVEVAFLNRQQEVFNSNIIDYVSKNSRNSRFSERKDAHQP